MANLSLAFNYSTTTATIPHTLTVRSTPTSILCIPPQCRSPDKRDFMDFQPERLAADFYRNYDPMIGIETAAILLAFIFLITIKSIIRYYIRHLQKTRYRKKLFAAAAAAAAATVTVDINNETDANKWLKKLNRKKTVRSFSTSASSNLARYNFAAQLNARAGRLSLSAGIRSHSQNCFIKNDKNIEEMTPLKQNNNINRNGTDRHAADEIGILTSI